MEIDNKVGDVAVSFIPKGMNEPLVFENADRLVSWAEKQKQFFNGLPRATLEHHTPISTVFRDRFNQLVQAAIGTKNQHPQHRQANRTSLEQVIKLIEAGALPTLETQRGKEIANLYATNPDAGAALLALTWDENSSSPPAWPTIIAAKAALEAVSGINYTAAKQAQEAVFEELRKTLSEEARNLLTEFRRSVVNANTSSEHLKTLETLVEDKITKREDEFQTSEQERAKTFDAQKKVYDNEWKALTAAYTTHMALRASVSYWNAKRKTHEIKAESATRWFGGVAVVSAIIVIIAAAVLLSAAKGEDAIIQIRATIFVGFPAFIAIWILRLISRRLIIHQALVDDAAERIAMIHAFKALEKEGKAEPSERLLVLQSLFRPATSPSDDTAPITIVNQLLKQSSSRTEE